MDDVLPYFNCKIIRTKHDDEDEEEDSMEEKMALVQIGHNSLTLMEASSEGVSASAIHSVRKLVHHTILKMHGAIKVGTAPP